MGLESNRILFGSTYWGIYPVAGSIDIVLYEVSTSDMQINFTTDGTNTVYNWTRPTDYPFVAGLSGNLTSAVIEAYSIPYSTLTFQLVGSGVVPIEVNCSLMDIPRFIMDDGLEIEFTYNDTTKIANFSTSLSETEIVLHWFITSLTITNMDNIDNCYAMKKYYTFKAVVDNVDGPTNIEKIYIQIKNGTEVVGEFRATNLTGTPEWAIQTGAGVFDLDTSSCSWAENGDEGIATFEIRVEWDITQYDDMDLEAHVEDAGGGYANFTNMQTDYVDLINRLVTHEFGSNTSSAEINTPIQIFGSVRYSTTTDGNISSASYPPNDEFTSVTIKNDQDEIEATDTTITNGNFNVTFNSNLIIGTTYYYAWLDLLADYVDGPAADGDLVFVTTTTEFYLSWLIDNAFNFFGIGNYLSQVYIYGSALGTYFAESISNLLLLIVQQFRIALGIFGFFVDWYTRMVSLVIQIGEIITGLIDGTGDVTSGLGNLWNYFDVYTWLDVIPLFFFIWWVESIARRGRVQGEISVFLGDIQTVMNITSWFISMFSLVVNTMTDLAFRLMEVIT